MHELTADAGWHWITGRGLVAAFKPRVWPTPPIKVGDVVKIDGGEFEISSIEVATPLLYANDPNPRRAIGFVVKTKTDVRYEFGRWWIVSHRLAGGH